MDETTAADVADLKARVKILEGQAKDLVLRVNSAEGAQKTIAQKLDDMLITLGEVKQTVNALQGAPGRKWEAVIMSAMSAVIAAAVGLIFAKF